MIPLQPMLNTNTATTKIMLIANTNTGTVLYWGIQYGTVWYYTILYSTNRKSTRLYCTGIVLPERVMTREKLKCSG